MSAFLQSEKARLADFKQTAPYFSEAARLPGLYKNVPYAHCLPLDLAEENLFSEIRHSAQAHFTDLSIKWHDGQNRMPSNHLCDSQVSCVNFLFPFADHPAALAALLRPVYPSLRRMLQVEKQRYVTFEWIGQRNYLGELNRDNRPRTRGANFTSADAAVMFEHDDGRRQFVLIEWKYTETYHGAPLQIAPSGTDRTAIYKPLYDREDCPVDKRQLAEHGFGSLFHEPFYQFMRQQFLAHEMERAREWGADVVSLLHIAPRANLGFRRITSPKLAHLGDSATGVWQRLLCQPDRFASRYTEDLFGLFPARHFPELANWYEYLGSRYSWVLSPIQV